jgi:adenylate cyclase
MADESRSYTFLFADLAGFTALTEAMGDADAADLAGQFLDAVRDLLPEHRAHPVKAIGDALMIRAEEASEAIRLGLRIVNEVGGHPFFPTVRVGMHTGPAVERDGDWFGATVNVAARVSGIAGGGEVILTEETRQAAGDLAGLGFHERGRQELRNVEEPVLLYAAVRRDAGSGSALPIDPVCRMAVDPEHAAGTITHEGTEYHFCSLACVQRFAAGPEKFTAFEARDRR